MRTGLRRGALAATLTLGLGASVALVPSAGAAGGCTPATPETKQLATGLTLTKLCDPTGPQQIRYLTWDPSAAGSTLTLDVVTAAPTLPGRLPTSKMAENHGAIAAINGDFTVDPGRPMHNYAADGQLKQTGFQNGASFAISKDKLHTYVQSAHADVDGRNLTSGQRFHVDEWNHGAPAATQITGFTKFGGRLEKAPRDSCTAKLKATSKMKWATGELGLVRNYKVTGMKCGAKPLSLHRASVVLASKLTGAGALILKGLPIGTPVRLKWRMVGTTPWSGAMDVIGGMPLLVDNGLVVAKNDCNTYFCDRNPRTGIGYTADGKIILVTVDGRAPGISVGMTLSGFADYMLSLGCVYSVNLDGGGSTTMWVKGEGVINRPTDSSGERWISNAVVILPGRDKAEPTPLLMHAAPGGSTDLSGSPALSADAAAADPGSTGGLMDALVGGQLGAAGPLPSDFVRMARAFRSAQARG